MADSGFKTITVAEQLYQRVKERAKKENKSAARFVSEILETFLYVEEKLSRVTPFLELISVDSKAAVVRDRKRDKVVGVRIKTSDGGKVGLYCELDRTDYCPHTAFATALPQVRNAIRPSHAKA